MQESRQQVDSEEEENRFTEYLLSDIRFPPPFNGALKTVLIWIRSADGTTFLFKIVLIFMCFLDSRIPYLFEIKPPCFLVPSILGYLSNLCPPSRPL